jgi:ABC-2 type transport system permease protein
MNAQLRSELFKQRTTSTSRWLLISTVALIAVVVLLHVVSLPVDSLSGDAGQLKVIGMGTTFGMLFAALLGALSITGEIRHGLIRPTLLTTPNRTRVILAKVAASALAGAVLGLVAEAVAIGIGSAGLAARGIGVAVTAAQFAQLAIGGAVAAACWAAIGVGIGALVRSQVVALIGLTVWQLFIEQTLVGILPSAARYAPGPSAGALAGAILQQTSTYLLAPAVGALMTAAYVTVTTVAGLRATSRHDFN